MYARYVHNSLVKTQEALVPLEELNKKIKASMRQLKKVRVRLKNELGIKVCEKAEREWIENTRIILNLENGTGWVDGGREVASYMSSPVTAPKAHNAPRPEEMVVNTDSGSLGEIADPLDQRKLGCTELLLPKAEDDDDDLPPVSHEMHSHPDMATDLPPVLESGSLDESFIERTDAGGFSQTSVETLRHVSNPTPPLPPPLRHPLQQDSDELEVTEVPLQTKKTSQPKKISRPKEDINDSGDLFD